MRQLLRDLAKHLHWRNVQGSPMSTGLGLLVLAAMLLLVYVGKATLTEVAEALPIVLGLFLLHDKHVSKVGGWVLIMTGLLLMVACKRPQASVQEHQVKEVTVRERSVPVSVPAAHVDSTFNLWQALGKSAAADTQDHFREPTKMITVKRGRARATLTVASNGQAKLEANCDSVWHLVAVQDSLIKVSTTRKEVVVLPAEKPTLWEKLGYMAAGAILAYAALKYWNRS